MCKNTNLLILKTNNYFCRTMEFYFGILVLITLRLFHLPGSRANDDNNVYFTTTKKPLQCHKVELIEVRSEVECALYCMAELYSCAGYVCDWNGNSHFECNGCFIFDHTRSPVTVEISNTTVTSTPDINKNTGEIPIKLEYILLY